VDFWASWCEPCWRAFPVLDKLAKQYRKKGFVVVGINVERDASKMTEFLKNCPVSFSIVRDKEQQLVAACDITSIPFSYLIDKDGIVRFVHSGFHGEKTVREMIKEIEELIDWKQNDAAP